MSRRARIVVDRFEPVIPSWNWRSDWFTRYDSAYSLLAKFAYLNAFAVRDLVQIFVSGNTGKKTAILRDPQVDLRDPSYFDLPAMSVALRADLDAVKDSFLFAMLPNGKRKSADRLRWCPKCAAVGFHSPLFQLEIITGCPIHGVPLKSTCHQCGASTPYRLRRDVVEIPFSCSACHADFAPVMRAPKTRSLQLRTEHIASLQNTAELLKFEDKLIPMKLEINRELKSHGMGELVIASADLKRRQAEYTGFVIEVLDELKAEMHTAQPPLPLVDITRVYRGVRCEPPWSMKKRKNGKPINARVSKSVPAIQKSWDDMLSALYTVYNAMRRRIWSRLIQGHQSCVICAGNKLWWHMEGERTRAFCPVAEAFLRWRMYWEGCGVPQHLFQPLAKPPFGILGWHAQAAPICPPGWSRATELWVTQHCFAQACLANFHEWVDVALANVEKGSIEWTKHATTGKFQVYWALVGHDSWRQPVRIYIQASKRVQDELLRKPPGADHYQHHRTQLAEIRR